MATSVSLAISRELTGGLDWNHRTTGKGQGGNHQPGRPSDGANSSEPSGPSSFWGTSSQLPPPPTPPQHRQVRWSHSIGATASALKCEHAGCRTPRQPPRRGGGRVAVS